MSDSVDRVFVHALNTVKRIPRTGTARPPATERLKLYGLYKQSMEGDVEGIMDRPIGDALDVQAEREKWDAWYSQRGTSRTEAKRRYITTLINTMHLYASQTEEARELVAELEFVWDQIKYNASSSSSSSPIHVTTSTTINLPATPETAVSKSRYGSIDDRMMLRSSSSLQLPKEEDPDADLAIYRRRSGDSRLRVLSPVSQSDEADIARSIPPDDDDDDDEDDINEHDDDNEEEEEEDVEGDEDDDEFQEARDGISLSEGTQTTSQDHPTDHNNNNHNNNHSTEHRTRKKRKRKPSSSSNPQPHNDWRRRVERALTKMTTEVAALREQIESRGGPVSNHSRRRNSFWGWLHWLFWSIVRQILWHYLILSAILIWMRIKGDRRLERRLLAIFWNFKNQLMTTTAKIPRRVPSLSSLAQLPIP